MLPADGLVVVLLSSLRVLRAPEFVPSSVHVAVEVPPIVLIEVSTYSVLVAVLIQRFPIG